MQENEITTPEEGVSPGQNQENQQTAEEQEEKTPKQGEEKPQKQEKKPVQRENSTQARLRILERENARFKAEQNRSQKNEDNDDELDPEDEAKLEKILQKKLSGRLDDIDSHLSENDKRVISDDVDRVIEGSEYVEYMEESHKDKVHEMALNPAYTKLSLNELILLSLQDDIMSIASSLSKKASEKIAETKLPSSSGGEVKGTVDIDNMTPEQWEKYKKDRGIG